MWSIYPIDHKALYTKLVIEPMNPITNWMKTGTPGTYFLIP
jgi:hypothetical protein